MVKSALLAAAATIGLSASALAETPQGAADQLRDFLNRFENLGPGYATVVVTADDILLNHVSGERRASTGAPMTADTPIYIASQTKAYLGLVAAVLDERGVFSLDTTIGEVWPDLGMADGVDIRDYTMSDLLSHQVPINVGEINMIEAYSATINPADYPRLIENFGEARDEGFEYDNLGYNIYAALLETATGKTWQDWMDEVLFDPLGMDSTSARTSDFNLDELSWSHIWQGGELGWYEQRPKTDHMMQSAGGLVTSTNDMAAWLQMQLRGEAPAGSGISASAIRTAQQGYVQTGMEDRRNAYELVCSEYTLGWNVCDFEGYEVHIHGGGYVGTRTQMAFVPELGIGIAAFSNSDNNTGWVTSRTINMYLQFLVEHEDAETWSTRRPEIFTQREGRLLEYRQETEAEARAEEQWGGWTWTPDADELQSFVGTFTTGEPYLDVQVRYENGALIAMWGDYHLSLEPAQPDLFGAQPSAFASLQTFQFERDESGRVTGLAWDGDAYTRTH